MRYLIPLQLWQLKTRFGDGLINFNNFLLKTLRLAALQRLGSSMFHSMTLDGKKEFLKRIFEKVMFSMKQSNFICISGITVRNFCWY